MDKREMMLAFYNAGSGEELYELVKQYNLDGKENWRPYGGNPNNAGTFENQQATETAGINEKLTNSLDGILMKECLKRGINPRAKNDPRVPKTQAKAVEQFFGVKDGRLDNITDSERNALAQNIQIVFTGSRTAPNIAIYDNGEGQNPDKFPETFLSLQRGNKNDIPFVQGKYNFGATGAVVFCGEQHKYQMIISRRHSELSDGTGMIGFTLVRRHILTKSEEQEVKLTWYEYLVIDDQIPSINAEVLDLGLYKTRFESGTIIKLYSYQLVKASDATLDFWKEMNTLMFDPALPILICENRGYNGNSNTKVLNGNKTRLALSKKKDKNVVFQKSFRLNTFGCEIPVTVYVFSRETKQTEFILNKSVVYGLNGQNQGVETRSFLSQELGLRSLRDYMLIYVDCSYIGTTARQELFMASRDRLKKGKYYNNLKNDLIQLIKDDDDISRLNQEYKGRTFKESGKDKELVESMFSHLKNNKEMRNMFSGKHGAFYFFNKSVQKTSEEVRNKRKGSEDNKKNFKYYPSIFRVKGFERDNEDYVKVIKKGTRGRILLETDVENEFLTRSNDNGSIEITTLDYRKSGGEGGGYHIPSVEHTKLNVQVAGPYDGEIKLIIEPKEEAEVGESIPLSIKMISSVGEHEVLVFVKVEKEEEEKAKKTKKKTVEEPDTVLPELIRAVKDNAKDKEVLWNDVKMTADDVVKFELGEEGEIQRIYINMDANLVKKLTNQKGVNIERVQAKYLRNIYSHALMIYTTIYGYYTQKNESIDETILREIKDSLQEAVEESFGYYATFLMAMEEFDD